MQRSFRRSILEEWRGLPEGEERPDRTMLLHDILKQLAPKLGFETRLKQEEIAAAWGEIVGDFFARHSNPAKLQAGVFTVNVLQPTVMYELDRQWKPVILEKLRKRFGAKLIKEIRFRLG